MSTKINWSRKFDKLLPLYNQIVDTLKECTKYYILKISCYRYTHTNVIYYMFMLQN